MIEVWKDVVGYEGIYRVSNLGKVKSLDRQVVSKIKKVMPFKEYIRKPRVSKNGYYYLNLSNSGVKKTFKVHRLVATAFVINEHNKPCINHIDGNKLNNQATNLEWVTPKENTLHAINTGKMDKNRLVKYSLKRRKPILMSSLLNEPLLWFDSLREASRETGTSRRSIVRCCKGETKQTKGYKWSYHKGEINEDN